MAAKVTELETVAEFEAILEANKSRLLIIDWHATWCGPCKRVTPVVEELQKENQNVKFLKIDVDKFGELAEEHNVKAMPSFEFIRNKENIYMFQGGDIERLTYWMKGLKDKDVSLFTPADIKALIENQPERLLPWYIEVATNLAGPLIVIVLLAFYGAVVYAANKIYPTGGIMTWGVGLLVAHAIVKIVMKLFGSTRNI